MTSSAASGVTAPSLLPAKRTFDSLTATLYEEDGLLHRLPLGQDLGEFYRPPCNQFYEAYLASKYRSDDVLGSDKPVREADSSDSDWEDAPPSSSSRQGMSRMEAKALDREIPWRKIMDLPSAQFQAYKEAVEKEHSSWMEWRSVRALTRQEASEVLKDKVLAKRVLRTRSCFRDKAKGLGPLRAKCRVVALGHNDPDLRRLNRECPTPNRTSEHVLFLVLVAGSNREFGNSSKKWFGWTGDAATAFLQGEPDDGVTRATSCWTAPLYLVLTNIYGLANAPRLWANMVVQRLKKLGYRQHSFDLVFLLFNKQDELISVILVYVDDSFGVHREDCSMQPVWDSFKWGSLNKVEPNKEFTFKHKQISLRERPGGRYYLHLCQAEFIEGLSVGKIPRGADLSKTLTPEQRAEFRSISGCLQWLSDQARAFSMH